MGGEEKTGKIRVKQDFPLVFLGFHGQTPRFRIFSSPLNRRVFYTSPLKTTKQLFR